MSAIHRRMLSVTTLCVALVACSTVPVTPPHPACMPVSPAPLPTPPQIKASRVEKLMLDYEVLRNQPASEFSNAYEKANQDFVQTASDSSRVKLAMLLALPDTPFHDTTVALNLLNNGSKDEEVSPSALRGFTHLLSTLLVQQQRSSNAFNDLEKKLKEEQKRAEVLQSKIDAIKNMEKNPISGSKPQ